MSDTTTPDRARGCLLGLAVGDAMGAPAENLTAEEIADRWGEITGFLSDDPAGTDDTEFAAFSALLLLEHGTGLTSDHVVDAWIEHLVDRRGFPGGGFSQLGSIENVRAGLRPPATGRHLHSWSDGLAMRAAVFGVFAVGDPAEAARLAAVDGVVSDDGEGVFGGMAVAAGVAAAMAGGSVDDIVAAALDATPADSWTSRAVRAAVDRAGDGPAAVLETVVVTSYPWTDLAPEAVGLAMAAFVAAGGAFRESVTGAIAMGRDADTTAAIAGALAGAHGGLDAVPPEWATAIGPVTGRCLGPVVAGLRLDDLGARLVETR